MAGKLRDIAVRLGDAPSVRVGFPSGSTYPDGTSLPLVAAINEFGAPSRNQPPRPFMRNTIARHSGRWAEQAARLLRANNYDVRQTLELVGEGIKGQMIEEIQTGNFPDLAPSTKARKGFDKPLIATGFMWRSITVEVVDEA